MPPQPQSSSFNDAQMDEAERASERLARNFNDPDLAPSQWAMNVANLALHTDLTGLATAKPLNVLTSDILNRYKERPQLIFEIKEAMQGVVNGSICPEILLNLGELHKKKQRNELYEGKLYTHLADEHMILQYLQAQSLHHSYQPSTKRRTNIIFNIMRKMCEQHDNISPFDIKDFQVHELYKPRLVDKKPINRTADFTFMSRLEATQHRTWVDLYKQITQSRLPFNPLHNKILSFSPMCGGIVVREGEGELIQAEASLHMNAWHAATVLHIKRLCRYIHVDYQRYPAPASIGLKIVNDTWTVSVGYTMVVDGEEKLCVEDIAQVPVVSGNVAGIYTALRMMNAIIEYFKSFYIPWMANIVVPAAIKTFSVTPTRTVAISDPPTPQTED